MELAVSNDVDFILLGGDLFHDASPSQNALNKYLYCTLVGNSTKNYFGFQMLTSASSVHAWRQAHRNRVLERSVFELPGFTEPDRELRGP